MSFFSSYFKRALTGYASFYAVLPLFWLTAEWAQRPGLAAVNTVYLLSCCFALTLIPRRTPVLRCCRLGATLLANTVATAIAMCLALTGALPEATVLASMRESNLHEIATVVQAAPLATLMLALSWMVQLAGLLILSSEPCEASTVASFKRLSPLLVLPLALPLLIKDIQATYPFAVFNMADKFLSYKQFSQQVDLSKLPRVIPPTAASNEVTVLVLGESSSAKYWQINGYSEATSPFMVARQANGELVNFRQHMSSASATFLAVPSILAHDGKLFEHSKGPWPASSLSLARAAGKRVGWLSTQSPQPASSEAQDLDFESSFYSYQHQAIYDEPLIGKAGAWLSANAKQSGILVLHTLGSHLPFEFRYPEAFKKWEGPAAQYPKNQTTENYLNTILYTDYVLEQLMRRLEQEARPAVLMYVSDHGETLMGGIARSRAPSDANVLHVPLMIWANSAWRKVHPDWWQLLQKRANTGHATHHLNLGPTLMHLSGVTYENAPYTRDLLAPEFEEWSTTPAITSDLSTVISVPVR